MSNKLRDMYNNNDMLLGFYPRTRYTSQIETKNFKEFVFDGKPLMVSHSEIPTTVYSLMNDKPFSKDVTVVLDNKMIQNITSPTDVTQTSFFSNYMMQGINLKTDYVFRLYKFNGFEYFNEYTGVVLDIKQTKNSISLKLTSRVTELKNADGDDTRTSLAGWRENSQFSDSLKELTKDTDIEYEGDIQSIDYFEAENESSVDLKSFPNSAGVYSYDNNEVIVSNISSADSSKYGTKYNFIADTIENFSLVDILHFSFRANDNKTYFVVEKKADRIKRVGQYCKLYLVEENALSTYTYLGYGRTGEIIEFGSNNAETSSLEGAYVKDNAVDSLTDIELTYFNGNYHYYNTVDSSAQDLNGFLGQVISSDGYFMPIFGKCGTAYFQSHQIARPTLSQNTAIYLGVDTTTIGIDYNTVWYDDYFITSQTVNTPISRQKVNESIKSRSYFAYDSVNDRLIFQRASDSAPNSTGYNIGIPLFKSWDNFGLNPIGFYNLSTSSLGYIDKSNDEFIFDWIADSGNMYMSVVRSYYLDYSLASTSDTYQIKKMTPTGDKSSIVSIAIIDGYVGYGLHFYDNKITFIARGVSDWFYYKVDIDTLSTDIKNLGSKTTFSSPTGSAIINAIPVLLIFKDEKLQYVDIETPINTIEYASTTLDKTKLGGYIVKAPSTEDYTAKFEDNLVTALAQIRGDLLDLTDLNRLQGLLMLCNMANKFIAVDERDVLIIRDLKNIINKESTLTDLIDVQISDVAEYRRVDVASYYVDDTEIFKWNINTGEYDQEVNATWNGADASFSMNITIIAFNAFTYKIVSDGTLETPETIYQTGTEGWNGDWNNIIINKGGDFIKISFNEINSQVESIPNLQDKFTLFFNSKTLKKTNITTSANDLTTTSLKTKKINNRFVSQDIAVLLRDDIEDYFLGKKKIYSVLLLAPLINFDPLRLINFSYTYEQIIDVQCYIRDFIVKENGTTLINLQEK
jgi:hypothetical protein